MDPYSLKVLSFTSHVSGTLSYAERYVRFLLTDLVTRHLVSPHSSPSPVSQVPMSLSPLTDLPRDVQSHSSNRK